MSELADAKSKMSGVLRTVAVRAADIAYQQGRQALRAAKARSGSLERAADKVAGRLRSVGDRLIAKSPIPVPDLAHDALGRMQEALGQLEHVILSGDVSTFKKGKEQHKMHQRGRVDTSDDGSVASLLQGRGRARHRARD